MHCTGLWLGYNGLWYGRDQVFAKSHRKNRNLARLEIYGRKKIGRNFFSLRDTLNCFGLVWIFSSLFPWAAELSAPRWRTLPVSHPAFTAGNRHSSGRGEHSWAVPVVAHMKIVKKFARTDFEKIAKGTLTFIDKGYHESSDSWLQFYHLFRVASWYRCKNY